MAFASTSAAVPRPVVVRGSVGVAAVSRVISQAGQARPEGPLRRWRLHLAYDGTDFCGWQKQAAGVRTIQGEVDLALSRVFRAEVKTVGASRTDAGVHAQGQVCHFDAPELWADAEQGLDPAVALRRLRRELPDALLATALGHAQPDFHSRLSAIKKRYAYRLALVDKVSPFEARYCWCVGGPLDLELVAAAAKTVSGQLVDYSVFMAGEHEPDYHGSVEKVVTMSMRPEGPHQISVVLECDRFLYRMVRRIVGALVEVGKGRLSPERLPIATRTQVPTAPAHGLCLEEITYPPEHPTPPGPPEVASVSGLSDGSAPVGGR